MSAIAEIGRNDQFPLAAYFHTRYAFVPSADDPAGADLELEGTAPIQGAVELGSPFSVFVEPVGAGITNRSFCAACAIRILACFLITEEAGSAIFIKPVSAGITDRRLRFRTTASRCRDNVIFVMRVVVFAFIAVMLAPQLGNPKISNSIFTIIQEGQGFISPGILAVFAFGLLIRKAPPMAGVIGLLTNIVAYGTLKLVAPQIQFLNRMAICFALCLLVMGLITAIRPLSKPVEFKQQSNLDLESSKGARVAGLIVIALTLILYFIFSPIGLAK